MSCFMVPDDHLRLMVQAARDMTRARRHGNMSWYWRRHPEDTRLERSDLDTLQESADRVMAMLRDENEKSVRFRYVDSKPEEMLPNTIPAYFPVVDASMIRPVWVMKAIQSYRYQSCEHPTWEQSEAFAFCESLEQAMIHALPEYDDAPTWCFDRTSYQRWIAEKRASIRRTA